MLFRSIKCDLTVVRREFTPALSPKDSNKCSRAFNDYIIYYSLLYCNTSVTNIDDDRLVVCDVHHDHDSRYHPQTLTFTIGRSQKRVNSVGIV